MFTYFHNYLPETWEGQLRSGLITKNSGVRMVQNITAPYEYKFNSLAKADGELFNIIKDTNMPFYVDRLQGGTYFEAYDYDITLIEKYKKLLGDKFYGFQMHEWISNLASDISKLEKGNCPEPWTKRNITETLFREFPFPFLFLEAVSPDEMEKFGHITDADRYVEVLHEIFEKRMKYLDGDILPCDSHLLGMQLEIAHGVKRFFIEVGAGTPNTRIQTALARGMSKAHGIQFGAYYEPWGGEPFGACCYQKDGKNEWFIGSADFPFQAAGGNGGSSRSLQKRIHYYEYLSGASFISEEWGMCNTFYDWKDFEITPYGKVKYDFIKFTEKYPDIGEFVAPIAVVLPEKLIALQVSELDRDVFATFELSGKTAEQMRFIKKNISDIFCATNPTNNSFREDYSLLNYIIPDSIDIVYEDKSGSYDYYIDLTCSDKFKKTHSNIITLDEIPTVLARTLPCKVETEMHYFFNKAKDCNYLTFLNNSGIIRSVAEGEKHLESEAKTAHIKLDSSKTLTMLEGNAKISKDGDDYYITVAAGDWFFGRIA